MSRLTKALREWWTAPPQPRGWGQVVTVRHAFYGPIRLFRWDEGISQHLFDGQTVWEPEVVEIFAREWAAGRNAIDAGANLGLHSIALAKLAAPGAKVYAIEPHPEVFPLTRANCRRFAAVKCIKAAASDRLRTVSMPRLRRGGNAAIAATIRASIAEIEALGYAVEQVSPHDYLCRPQA